MHFLILVFLSLIMVGCQGYKYNQDNLIEEVAEAGIKAYTGADIDLSPRTPETGFSPHALLPVEKVK